MRLVPLAACLLTPVLAACRPADHQPDRSAASAAASDARSPVAGARSPDTLVVYLAASLTRPLGAALDSFAARTGATIERESGASLEHARKITELHRVPDVIALADAEVFPQLLQPRHVAWYADFARNRMSVLYTDRSRHAAELDSSSWTRILARPDVEVGRADPDLAPVGYRTILMLRLAERQYRQPGLADRLLANAPRRNMRPNASELAALLEVGELDYVYDYESVAVANGFRHLTLPPAIDLGDLARAAEYARVSVRVRGAAPGESTTVVGQPILYALAVPRAAPHPRVGIAFAAFLLSPEGRALLRAGRVDALERPVLVGDSVPASIRAAATR